MIVRILCCIVFSIADFTNLSTYTGRRAALMIFQDLSAAIIANVVMILGGVSVSADGS